jgi:PAS domain S-box-containing protein
MPSDLPSKPQTGPAFAPDASGAWQVPEHGQYIRQHLELVLDNVPAMVAYYDALSIRCVFANQLYAQVYGWRVEQVVGMHCRDIIGLEAWELIAPHVNAVLAGKEVRYEREVNVPGVPKRHMEVSLLPHYVDAPQAPAQLVGAFVLINDITQRYQAEQRILEREQRAMRFANASSEGIVFYEDGIIRDCNEAFCLMLKRSREELLGKHVEILFAKDDRLVASRHMHLGRETAYAARLPLPDGSLLDVEIRGKAVQLDGRQASVASVRDVSQLTNVNEALLRSQTRYRTLVENSDQGAIFILDRKVVYTNPAAQKMFGLSEPALRGVESVYLLHPDDRAYALHRRKQMMAGDPNRDVVLRTISPPSLRINEKTRVSWVRLYGSMLEWDGRAGILIFLTDITALRESEEAVRKALAQEKELGDLKTRFVSMASHEFRTPLSTIQTSSELLQHYNDRLSTEERMEAIADIQRSVQRMQAMMESFLVFGRMSAGSTIYSPQPMLLLPSLQAMMDEARSGTHRRHAMSMYLQAPITAETRLMLDELLLRQMVINLITNACKYSEIGTQISIVVSQARTETGVFLVIVVSDQGMGIPEEDLPLLFTSFHRASNAGAISGTGLGLAIVDRAARAHGGTVQVRSQLGQGSTFTLQLPWQDCI